MSEKANAIIESALVALRAEAEDIHGKITALEGVLKATGVSAPIAVVAEPKKVAPVEPKRRKVAPVVSAVPEPVSPPARKPAMSAVPNAPQSKTEKLKEAANKRAASWTPDKKKAAAERMRKYWAERKKSKAGEG